MSNFASSNAHPFVVSFPDIGIDAFGRLRQSNPETIFDSQFQFDTQPLRWQSSGSVGGTATFLPNESSVQLTVPSTAGASIIRQSYEYIRYQPGHSQLILMTGVLGASVANVTKRLGYYDSNNGPYFQVANGGPPQVVVRNFISGSVTEAITSQASWNMDTLDGSKSSANPSGLTLDMTQAQIFTIDLQWLGVGRVRFGFGMEGKTVYCHQIDHANAFPNVYMTTANLPVRYELFNTGLSGGASMKQICSSVISEGGIEEDRGIIRGTSNGGTLIAVTTRRPILSIRPTALFNGVVNRAHITPLEFKAYTNNTGDAFVELLYNGVLTGANWANAIGSGSVASMVDSDIAATAIVGGMVVAEGYCNGAITPIFTTDITSKLPFTLDLNGQNPAIFTIVVTQILASSPTMSGAFKWREIY